MALSLRSLLSTGRMFPPGTIYQREGWEPTSLPNLRGLAKYLMAQPFL